MPVRRGPRWFAAIEGWRGIGWFATGVAGSVAIVWFIFVSRGEIGSKADWFFGAVVFCVVMVTMWQTLNIQRQANQNAAHAEERHRMELASAEEHAARAEIGSAARAGPMSSAFIWLISCKQAHRGVAHVNGHTQLLATLWNQAASILSIDDLDEQELAMNPIFSRSAKS